MDHAWWCSLPGLQLFECAILPSFCHTNRLLLHSFMDADPVMFFDAVEFINAAQTTIWQDQGSCLQMPINSIFHCCYCQSFNKLYHVLTNSLNPVIYKNDWMRLYAVCTILHLRTWSSWLQIPDKWLMKGTKTPLTLEPTCTCWSNSSCEYRARNDLSGILQELRLPCARVTNQQHVTLT